MIWMSNYFPPAELLLDNSDKFRPPLEKRAFCNLDRLPPQKDSCYVSPYAQFQFHFGNSFSRTNELAHRRERSKRPVEPVSGGDYLAEQGLCSN
jgi:hypothetical protein